MQWSGAVLTGGKSRRFGRDKARHIYQGKPLLAWVLDSLGEADERFAVGNSPLADFGVALRPDLLPNADSLSGLHAALVHAQYPWVAVAACDQPFLTRGFWNHLLQQAAPSVQAVAVASGPHLEPLGALYRKDLHSHLEQHIQSGQFKLQAVFEEISCVRLDLEEVQSRFGPKLFLNANRLQDLP